MITVLTVTRKTYLLPLLYTSVESLTLLTTLTRWCVRCGLSLSLSRATWGAASAFDPQARIPGAEPHSLGIYGIIDALGGECGVSWVGILVTENGRYLATSES